MNRVCFGNRESDIFDSNLRMNNDKTACYHFSHSNNCNPNDVDLLAMNCEIPISVASVYIDTLNVLNVNRTEIGCFFVDLIDVFAVTMMPLLDSPCRISPEFQWTLQCTDHPL